MNIESENNIPWNPDSSVFSSELIYPAGRQIHQTITDRLDQRDKEPILHLPGSIDVSEKKFFIGNNTSGYRYFDTQIVQILSSVFLPEQLSQYQSMPFNVHVRGFVYYIKTYIEPVNKNSGLAFTIPVKPIPEEYVYMQRVGEPVLTFTNNNIPRVSTVFLNRKEVKQEYLNLYFSLVNSLLDACNHLYR